MSRTMRQALLAFTSALMALMLLLFLMLPRLWRGEERPAELAALAAWLADHPADWLAASAIAEQSLDSAVPRRYELWRAAYVHAQSLAPARRNASAAFVRAGLFHWYELPRPERKAVLDTAAVLMRDERVFASMHRPIWELTHDFAYLRRIAPPGMEPAAQLRDLAAAAGEFAQYRQLRDVVRAERLRELKGRAAGDSLAYLPARLDTADTPLVREILEQLDRSAIDPRQIHGRIEDVARFAVEHGVEPLSALAPLVDVPAAMSDATRARLAAALGRADAATRIEMSSNDAGTKEWFRYYLERAQLEASAGRNSVAEGYRARARLATRDLSGWSETCGPNELCTTAVRQASAPQPLTLEVVQSDEIPPYVEIYVDDTLVAEGEISGSRTFNVGAAGPHRLEVRLINRYTRSGIQRRVKLGE